MPAVTAIRLCDHTDWDPNRWGECSDFSASDNDVRDNAVGNDRASIVFVPAGWKVALYEDVDYKGRCEVFTSTTNLPGTKIGNDTVSSLQIGVSCPSADLPTRYKGVEYGSVTDSNGKHWYVEFNVSPRKASQFSWGSKGPRGSCDDPKIKNKYVVGEPYCSTWGPVTDAQDDNLVRVGISLLDSMHPQRWFGDPSKFEVYIK